MEKDSVVLSVEFKAHAQEFVTMVFFLCENRLAECLEKGNPSSESKAFAAAAMAVKTSITAFMALEDLFN